MSRPLDLVIVTFNSEAVIGTLLDSVPAACGGVPHRVVVVDNSSTDTTRDVVSARSDARLLVRPNLGFAAGVNAGVEELAGQGPVLVLNADVELAPDSVVVLMEALDELDAGIVVPRLLDPSGTTMPSLRREPTLLRTTGMGESRFALLSEVVIDARSYEKVQHVEWATGAALLISRACYEALGFLDESFFMYSEETDFFLRARDLGFRAFLVPAARVTHIGGQSGRNPDLYAMQVLNRIRLYRRRHALVPSMVMVALVAAREAVWAARGNQDSRRALTALCSPAARPTLLPWTGLLRRSAPRRQR